METITWNEYKARSVNKDGFRLTHYSPLFNNAFCMVNVEQKIGTVTHQIGWDTRYFEKEWNNQVNQVADRHMSEYVEITAEVLEVIKSKLESYKKALKKASDWLATGLSGYDYNQAINDKTFNAMMVEKYEMILSLCPAFECEPQDEKTGDVMTSQTMQQIKLGFIEAMYFADGADPDMKDDEGFYLDGQFNNCFDLSENAQKNINDLIETIVPKLPVEVFEVLNLDRIGMCIYYEVQGHGTGFQDEDLTEETQEKLYQLFFNSVFLEIYDNDDTQEIELSYSENWS